MQVLRFFAKQKMDAVRTSKLSKRKLATLFYHFRVKHFALKEHTQTFLPVR